MANEVKKWVIALSGSEWDTVETYSFEWTKSQVKKVLVDIVKEDKIEDPDSFDYGTEKVSEVEERPDGTLYAGVVFSSCHNDYVAKPIDMLKDISVRSTY